MSRSESVKETLLRTVQSGIHPGNHPLGYCHSSSTFGPPQPDPVTSPSVILAFTLRAAGHSLEEICHILKSAGVRSSRGKVISRQALYSIVTNPFYRGMIRLNGTLYPGKHEPLVSAELFEAANGAVRSEAASRSSAK